jgi:hypothetical protein
LIIILEGPDGSGKSTTAKRLGELILERFPEDRVVHLHKGPPTATNWLDEYLEPLATYQAGVGEHLILDRWHWGEEVYPKLWNRPSLFTHPSEWWYLEAFLRSRGALVLQLDGSARLHAERVIDRAVREGSSDLPTLDELVSEQASQARLFTRAAKQSCVHRITITGDPTDKMLFRVLDRAWGFEEAARSLLSHPTYVGPASPLYLLLGDQRGPRRRDIPVAFAPLKGTSGYFLLRALPPRWLAENEVGIANACEDPDLDDLLDLLGHPRVIALGHEAANATSHLERATMPHPQWCRRFQNAAHHKYGEAVVEALEKQKEMLTWRP